MLPYVYVGAFHVGSRIIYPFGILVLAGILAGIAMLLWRAGKLGLDRQIANHLSLRYSGPGRNTRRHCDAPVASRQAGAGPPDRVPPCRGGGALRSGWRARTAIAVLRPRPARLSVRPQ